MSLLNKAMCYSWILLLLAALPSRADIIYSQGQNVSGGVNSDPGSLYVADDFELPGMQTVTGLTWKGGYSGGNTPQATDLFNIVIFGDNAGKPDTANIIFNGAPLSLTRVDTGADLDSYTIYQYTSSLPSLDLTGSTTYWLSIANDTTADTDDLWFWARDDGPAIGNSPRFAQGSQLNDYASTIGSQNMTFALTGATVPEPSSFVAFAGLSALGLLFLRRRRRQ